MSKNKKGGDAMAIAGPSAVQAINHKENSISLRVTYKANEGQTHTRVKWSLNQNPVDEADYPKNALVTTCLIPGLNPNTTYGFEVYGLKNTEESVYFAQLQAATLPATSIPEPPTNLNGTPTKDSIALTWQAVSNATSYNISHGLAPNGPIIKTQSSTSNAFTIPGLNSNTEYYCDVSSSNNNGDSKPRRINRKTLQVPAAPTELKATPTTSTMDVEWKASTGAGYYFYRYGIEPGGAPQTFDTTPPNATLTNLVKNTLYFIEVSAVNHNGSSLWARTTARTLDGPSLPPKPGRVTVSSIEQHSMRANWAIPRSPEYKISYGVDDEEHKVIGTLTTSYLTVELSGLAPGIRHFIDVRGFNGSDVSDPSSTTATTLIIAGPKNLSISETTDASAVFQWGEGEVYPPGTRYEVYLNGSLRDTISEARYTLSGLMQGTTYEFKVCAIKVEGWRSVFAIKSFTTLPFEAPLDLSSSDITDASATFQWKRQTYYPSDTRYEIYLNGEHLKTIGETRHVVTDLTQSTSYEFKVRAVKVDGGRSPFAASSFSTLRYEGQVICAPGNLKWQRLSSTTARLDWDNPYAECTLCPSAKAFEISGADIKTFEVPGPPCEVTGLRADKRYTVGVRVSGGGNNISAPRYCDIGGFPGAPGPLQISAVTSHSATLKWAATTGSVPVFDYLIYLDEESIASTRGLEFPLTSLEPAKAYTVQVRARTVESTLSHPVEKVFTTKEVDDSLVPNAPTNFRYKWVSLVLVLEWDAPREGAVVQSYHITLKRAVTLSYDSPTTQLSPGFLLPGHFDVTIRARNAVGDSPPLISEMLLK